MSKVVWHGTGFIGMPDEDEDSIYFIKYCKVIGNIH